MNNSTPEGFYGVIAERTKETDYQLGGIPLLPQARHTFAENKIQYYQPDVSIVSCTLHGAIGAVSDLTGYTFTLEERKQLWNKAITMGASDNGWVIDSAVDLVRQYWNAKNPSNKITTFTVYLDDRDFDEIIKKGYSVVCGYRGNSEYNLDHLDGILDKISFGESVYGHCLRITEKDAVTYNLIVDNYSKTDHNTYAVPKANFKELVKNRVFFRAGYISVLSADVEALNLAKTISPWAQVSVQKAKNKGLDMSQPSKQLTVAEIENYLFKLGIITSKLGNITQERMAVILDRIHLL